MKNSSNSEDFKNATVIKFVNPTNKEATTRLESLFLMIKKIVCGKVNINIIKKQTK